MCVWSGFKLHPYNGRFPKKKDGEYSGMFNNDDDDDDKFVRFSSSLQFGSHFSRVMNDANLFGW